MLLKIPVRITGVVLLWVMLPATQAVDRMELSLGRIEFNHIDADDVAVELVAGNGDDIALRISAASLTLPDSRVLQRLEIDCESGALTTDTLRCREGIFHVHDPDHGAISGRVQMDYRLDGGAGQIVFSAIAAGKGNVAGNMAFDNGGWSAGLQGQNLELSWLRGMLAPYGIWPADYSDESGSVDIDVRITGNETKIHQIQGLVRARDAGFYGANAAESLSGEIHFDVDARDGWQIEAEGNLNGGSLFVEPGITVGNIRPGIALEVTGHPLRFVLAMQLDAGFRQLQMQRLDIDHRGVMTAQGQAVITLGEETVIHDADVELTATDTGKLYSTWLQPFLLDTQFNAMETAGALQAGLHISNNELRQLDLEFTDLHAYDGNGRFHIAGLEGSLRITEAATPVSSSLSWQGAGIYRLNIGAGRLALESSNRALAIVRWEDVPVLDGTLQIDALNISRAGSEDMSIRLDGALTPIDMAAFTQAMGWPLMSGELTGAISGLTYQHGNLTVDGEINIGLFDGTIVIRHLRIGDLFGLVPVLYADIDIHKLDLELVTGRFAFGKIEGRLSGKVHRLELQAWQPVYFEAALATPQDDDNRHRISQQAVDNLGYIGGGAINALSSGFLRFFKDYSYGRLGIGCRLVNGVCQLSGVSDTRDGFVIVSRGGLLPPWIEVKGSGHSIAWSTLIEALNTISANRPEFR